MKHLRFLLLALAFGLSPLASFGQIAPLVTPFEPYAVKIGEATYTVVGADTANGYRVTTPDGRTIGLPAVDPAVKLTPATLTTALATPPAPAVVVPATVTRRQLFLWLNTQGHTRAAIRALLEQTPDATQREAALIEFDEARDFARTHPLILQLAPLLGYTTPAQLDAAFTAASAL